MDALAAFEKYESTIKAVAANREAHRYALEKYMAGKSAVYEYNEIKMKLADALSQQSQTKYNLFTERTDIGILFMPLFGGVVPT